MVSFRALKKEPRWREISTTYRAEENSAEQSPDRTSLVFTLTVVLTGIIQVSRREVKTIQTISKMAALSQKVAVETKNQTREKPKIRGEK